MHLQVAAATLAGALAALACGGDDEEGVDGNGTASTAQVVEVVAKDLSFKPAKLRGTAGATVEITLKNNGQFAHTFTIDEFNVDTEIAAGDETTVTVLLSEVGQFKYYCRFHRDQGMLGEVSTTGDGGAGATGAPTSAPAEGPTDEPYEY